MCKNALSQVHSYPAPMPAFYATKTAMENLKEQRERQRATIRRVMEVTGLNLTTLAKRASVAHTTLTRYMNKDVSHILSARTMAKIEGVAAGLMPEGTSDEPCLLRDLGKRMKLVRDVMAPNTQDDAIARALGWTPEDMRRAFSGEIKPSLAQLLSFAQRFNVTTDFLLMESLEGLPRSSERLLAAACPKLGMNIPHRTGTDQL